MEEQTNAAEEIKTEEGTQDNTGEEVKTDEEVKIDETTEVKDEEVKTEEVKEDARTDGEVKEEELQILVMKGYALHFVDPTDTTKLDSLRATGRGIGEINVTFSTPGQHTDVVIIALKD